MSIHFIYVFMSSILSDYQCINHESSQINTLDLLPVTFIFLNFLFVYFILFPQRSLWSTLWPTKTSLTIQESSRIPAWSSASTPSEMWKNYLLKHVLVWLNTEYFFGTRVCGSYYNWAVAAPMVLSMTAFQKNLPKVFLLYVSDHNVF